METKQLADVVQRYPDLLGDATAMHAEITAKTIEQTNSAEIKLGGLIKAVGRVKAVVAATVLESAGQQAIPESVLFRRAQGKFDGQGLDFSDNETHELLELLRASLDAQVAGLTDELKAIGRYSISRVEESFGRGETCTVAEVQDAINMHVLSAWFESKYQTAKAKIEDGVIADQAGVIAELQA